ncbi:TatD family hydrolase [Sphingobacterium litopenaei]|uniref:TatD family hydrolase n=1 Tax=Sphingobacterium litopenaei TaxID=2763500 RepID=A0ABR7Y9P5_9SPHI|nr:TatD family hydrolase [Sphingobacterium litopenaei]MBD1428021.1 TatD family hydrolase [Sphingobacterium litopenaei]
MLPYIDIHNHRLQEAPNSFQLLNCISGKENFPEIPCSVGIHPWYVLEDVNAQYETLKLQASKENALAIGECGLDKLTETNWQLQIEIFEKQIQLANELQKPLIIHSVKAYQEVFATLREQKVTVPVIFHGFNKKAELGNSILLQGYYISFGTSILQGNQDDFIQSVDLEKIFFETDDKSTNVVDIYSYFCSVRKIRMSALQEQIIQNFKKIFRYTIVE